MIGGGFDVKFAIPNRIFTIWYSEDYFLAL
jgi:hypothetical protein